MSKDSHHLFEGLAHHSIKTGAKVIDVKPGETTPPSVAIEFALILGALLTFAGNAAAKVVFWRNPKLSKMDIFLFLASAAGFVIVGGIYVNMSHKSDTTRDSDSNVVIGIIYIMLGLYILVRGISHCRNKKVKDNSSRLKLVSFKNKIWSDKMIHELGEPLIIVVIGLILTAYNEQAGLPLFFCALSVWLHVAKDRIMGKNDLSGKVNAMNEEAQEFAEFTYVND